MQLQKLGIGEEGFASGRYALRARSERRCFNSELRCKNWNICDKRRRRPGKLAYAFTEF
jgi:hypothetical protein